MQAHHRGRVFTSGPLNLAQGVPKAGLLRPALDGLSGQLLGLLQLRTLFEQSPGQVMNQQGVSGCQGVCLAKGRHPLAHSAQLDQQISFFAQQGGAFRLPDQGMFIGAQRRLGFAPGQAALAYAVPGARAVGVQLQVLDEAFFGLLVFSFLVKKLALVPPVVGGTHHHCRAVLIGKGPARLAHLKLPALLQQDRVQLVLPQAGGVEAGGPL